MQDRNMDDFSFPAIPTDQDSVCQQPFPHFAASPLWFLSSATPDEDNADCQLHRSLSSAEDTAGIVDTLNTTAAARSHDEGSNSEQLFDSEDKMDMLWEDFNEELRRVSCELKKDAKGGQQVLGLSKVCGRKASLVVMLNMLKKLFLLQKTNSTKRSLPFKKL